MTDTTEVENKKLLLQAQAVVARCAEQLRKAEAVRDELIRRLCADPPADR